MQPTLVILAAGMGSRYGGLKQLDAVGPGGETMLDFAVFDAIRAGFGRLVFVIRREFANEFRARIGDRYAQAVEVAYVFQELDTLPAGFVCPPERTKPWGTGHAVWCARAAVAGPFAVINADDFYGRDSLVQLARFLRAEAPAGRLRLAMVGFRLANTLSENGAVSRGVCTVGPAGGLHRIVEQTGIRSEDVGTGRTFSGDEIVSMNCWALKPGVFGALDRQLAGFLQQQRENLKSEFYLPAAISAMIESGEADVAVLPTQANWFGITYREDKPRVVDAIGQLVSAGEYPAKIELPLPS